MRTSKGPGHARLAISVLEQARAQGVTALMAYNTVLRVREEVACSRSIVLPDDVVFCEKILR